MSFGNGYQPQEYNQFVAEGDYFVRLGMPQDIERGGYKIRSIPVEYKGMPGYGPKTWDIFDAPVGDKEKMQSWNEQRTRDADAFGVERGDFRPEAWRGKTGWIHVGPDKAGYIKVKWSLLKPKTGATLQEGKDYPRAGQKPAQPAGAPPRDDFTDDIPF
jgi:hypothetical protein